jgi:Raf kinase inhibitor-like YbhB/YbcL family protein
MADAAFTLTSPAFAAGGEIPKQFTCEGAEQSPPLVWTGAPADTRSFALIVDDPDAPDPKAPKMTWVHWVVYDIPETTTSLQTAAGAPGGVTGARDGTSSWKRPGYGGPCPPIGRHRYFHKLFALDTVLGDKGTPSAEELAALMEGHVLGRAELIGTYEK